MARRHCANQSTPLRVARAPALALNNDAARVDAAPRVLSGCIVKDEKAASCNAH